MIEVPYKDLIADNYYYITQGPPKHPHKTFGKFMRTDHKPNGEAWVYFSDIEKLSKKKDRPTAPNIVYILTNTDIYEDDPSLQEWYFYKELAQPKKRSMYETVLSNVLKDPNAIKEFSTYIPATRSNKGKPKKGGKRTKKQRKTYKKHK